MKILVLGAGRMGYGAAFDLVHNSPGVDSVTVADFDLKKAEEAAGKVGTSRINACLIDAANYSEAMRLMAGHDSAISCVNYWYNESLSRAAIETGTNFCDLGGNNYVVDSQLALDEEAKAAGINIIPDCGLAPGMVSILAMHGAAKFAQIDEIHIRVGGLPQNPKPPLDYQLVFSVEGLINEYIEVARVIRDGKIKEVPSMTELESLSFDGFPPLEAFQTSGGTSTLPDTFLGIIKELDYKTIRYAGHCDKFKTMIDLGLCSSDELVADFVKTTPRKVFGELLQKHLPADGPDYVLVRLEFVGHPVSSPRVSSPHVSKGSTNPANNDESAIRNPRSALTRLRYDIIDKQDEETGLSAMMRTTAFPASIIAQMMAIGDVLERGATPQEKAIDPTKFVAELELRNIHINMYDNGS
ncbi:MAG: saccharopine dehydrogenase C-terminal domain-containing protein [Blastocatellia bacterium]